MNRNCVAIFRGQTIITPVVKVSAKVHTKKPWMKDSYHRRIQKKWNKRFGFTRYQLLADDQIIYNENDNSLLMSEASFNKLKKSNPADLTIL